MKFKDQVSAVSRLDSRLPSEVVVRNSRSTTELIEAYVIANHELTSGQIARGVGVDEAHLSGFLRSLSKQGRIVRRYLDGSYRYYGPSVKLPKAAPETYESRAKTILSYIEKFGPDLLSNDIAFALGITVKQTAVSLKNLTDSGRVSRFRDSAGRWRYSLPTANTLPSRPSNLRLLAYEFLWESRMHNEIIRDFIEWVEKKEGGLDNE